jgi:modulator of FtsH protease
LIFVRIPRGELICSMIGLVVFAGLTIVDFQRLRRSSDLVFAPLLAASIFLDAFKVFLFFLGSSPRATEPLTPIRTAASC